MIVAVADDAVIVVIVAVAVAAVCSCRCRRLHHIADAVVVVDLIAVDAVVLVVILVVIVVVAGGCVLEIAGNCCLMLLGHTHLFLRDFLQQHFDNISRNIFERENSEHQKTFSSVQAQIFSLVKLSKTAFSHISRNVHTEVS